MTSPPPSPSPPSDGRKAKRIRVGMSCKPCQRRKVKCDRTLPVCGPCVKRGGDDCSWDSLLDGSKLAHRMARIEDVDGLAARIAAIEAYLHTLPSQFGPFVPGVGGGGAVGGAKSMAAKRGASPLSDTEDAAVTLENGVFSLSAESLSGERRGKARSKPFLGSEAAGHALIPASLTSIFSAETYTSREWKDVDNTFSGETAAARTAALLRVIRLLPPQETVRHLVHLYFTRIAWLFHHVYAESFSAELDAFYGLENYNSVDPLWVALLCMILCVALDGQRSARSPLALATAAAAQTQQSPPIQVDAPPEAFFHAAQRALALGDWMLIPRVRTIQCIILITQYLQLCSPTRGLPSQMGVWLSAGIRIAQTMGLHLLGADPESMPPDDPAWPPGKNSVKRETAKRLWGILVYQDWLGASAKNRCYSISPYHFDTEDPSNVNDSDLSTIDWHVTPAPDSVLTDSTPDRVRIAMSRQVRKVFDSVVLSKGWFTYETVLELDRGFRQILESLPDRWIHENNAEEVEQPMLRYQRHFALEGLHNRIFRLHRPFSTRGYTQPKYKYSTEACIKSAHAVIVSTHNLGDSTRDIWYTYAHVMGAALVLFNDLFHAIDHDASSAEIESKRQTLALSAEIFAKSDDITSAPLQKVAAQCSRILQGLFQEVDLRRDDHAARTLMAPAAIGPAASTETFATVLYRVAKSLNSDTAPHTGTPPPTRNIPPSDFFREDPGTGSIHSDGGVSGAWWPSEWQDSAVTEPFTLEFLQDLGMGQSQNGAVESDPPHALKSAEYDETANLGQSSSHTEPFSFFLDHFGSGW